MFALGLGLTCNLLHRQSWGPTWASHMDLDGYLVFFQVAERKKKAFGNLLTANT